MQFLEAQGYSHWSPLGVANVTAGFAAQLEAKGLWPWAVYVLQHIPDDHLYVLLISVFVTYNFISY